MDEQGRPVLPLSLRSDDPKQPQISEQDLRAWLKAHPLSDGWGRGEQTIERIELVSGLEARVRVQGRLRVGDERLLYIVTIRGNFAVGPPALPNAVSGTTAFRYFDARTGSLILEVIRNEK